MSQGRVVTFSTPAVNHSQKRETPMGRKLVERIDKNRWRGSTRDALEFLTGAADDSTRLVRGQGLNDIAGAIGVSWQRAKTIMQTLRKAGAIETVKRGGGTRTNTYRITLPPLPKTGTA